MIDKDLSNIYRGMIKTSYKPVIRRAIVLLLIRDMDKMQAGLKMGDLEFFEILRREDAKKALYISLDNIAKSAPDIIQEILFQYGINTSNAMVDFYHQYMREEFFKIIPAIKMLIARGRYDILDKIARMQPT